MIRNNDEYMLPDGSPRYGIRVGNGLVDTQEPEPVTAPSGEAPAVRADELNSFHLAVAGDLRFMARGHRDSDEALQQLREAHPTEFKEAEEAVVKVLESPAAWRRRSTAAARQIVVNAERSRGRNQETSKGVILGVALAAFPLVVCVILTVVGVNYWIAAGIYVALHFAVRPFRSRLERQAVAVEGINVTAAAVSLLWDDVVDATFIRVMSLRGLHVDPLARTAGTAGWEHLRSIAADVDRVLYPEA